MSSILGLRSCVVVDDPAVSILAIGCDPMQRDRYDTIRRRRNPRPIVVAMSSSLRCRCCWQYADPIFKEIRQKLAKIQSIECNTILVLSRDAKTIPYFYFGSRSRSRSEKRITLYSITHEKHHAKHLQYVLRMQSITCFGLITCRDR